MPRKKSKLIVLFPVYNGEEHLKECLECIAGQTFKDFRGIIVENHSTDNTMKIAEEFAKKDNRFEVVQNEAHVGPIENFVHATQKYESEAEYITFRAHDDLSTDNYLKALVDALDHAPEKQIAITDSIQTMNGQTIRRRGHDPRIVNFQKNFKSNKSPRRLVFPSDAFYGLYRCGIGTEVFTRRTPELGTPWCAASFMLAEFIIRDMLVHVEDAVLDKRMGSQSKELYGTLPIKLRFQRRYEYGKGIWDLGKFLEPMTFRQRLKLLEIAWRDAKKKTGYYIAGI